MNITEATDTIYEFIRYLKWDLLNEIKDEGIGEDDARLIVDLMEEVEYMSALVENQIMRLIMGGRSGN